MFNVFKRPMFKRGGPSKGTGIMSHVEPRINARVGYYGANQNIGQTQPPLSIADFYKKKMESFKTLPVSDVFTVPPQNYYGYTVPTVDPRVTTSKVGIPSIDVGMTGDPAQFAGEDLVTDFAALKEKVKTPPPTVKKEPEYKGTDIKAEVEKEAALLKDILKDEGYSKGELALLVAGAVSEPGSIGDKLNKARELAIPLAKQKRKEDKAVTLTAYQLAKAKEREQIKAGKGTPYLQNIEAVAEAMSKQPGENRSKEELRQVLLASKSPGAEERFDILEKLAPNLLDAEAKIRRLTAELKEAEAKGSTRDIKRIQSDIDRQLSEIQGVLDFPELDLIVPGLKDRLGLNQGGRVMRAIGSSEEGEQGIKVKDDIISSDVSFGSGSATTSEPVQQLSYQELRDRLPPEITDDVVNLLANNAEALQSFAYIRTQDDINAFNAKYGVNLVIPPTRA